jgi:P-type conjugative transfer protein TrbJ
MGQRQLIWLQEAAELAKSLAQEVQVNVNLVNSYVQDAKAFVALPQATIADLRSTIQPYYDLLQQGRSMTYTLQGTVGQFNALYDGLNGNQSVMERAEKMYAAVNEAGRIATQAQSLFERLCNQKTTTDRLLQTSMAAPGTLSALQAQAQLTGVMIEQQGIVQELQSTSGRLQAVWIMQQTTGREQVRQYMQESWMKNWPTAQDIEQTGAKLPGVPEALR